MKHDKVITKKGTMLESWSPSLNRVVRVYQLQDPDQARLTQDGRDYNQIFVDDYENLSWGREVGAILMDVKKLKEIEGVNKNLIDEVEHLNKMLSIEGGINNRYAQSPNTTHH